MLPVCTFSHDDPSFDSQDLKTRDLEMGSRPFPKTLSLGRLDPDVYALLSISPVLVRSRSTHSHVPFFPYLFRYTLSSTSVQTDLDCLKFNS